MMNSTHNSESYAASPFMSFVGLEGSGSTHSGQKHQLWDWDSSNSVSSTTHSFPFYAPPLLEAPPPPLFSTVPLPFYFPPQLPPPPPPTPQSMAIPDYPRSAGFFKLDDGLSAGLGGGYEGARIGLNLGHRTYFSSYDHQLLLFGRSAHHQPPRCQAEGCMADLSGAKHYHRRHKVCDFHSKAAVVFFPGGMQQRFCQQCSRFHGLAEFDDAKRSCRKRLAEHNRRRRKPQSQPPLKGASPSSLAPSINPKEEGDLQASASKGSSKQLSSISKPCNPTAHIRSSSSTSMEKKVTLAQYTSGSALSLGGVAGSVHEQRISTYVSLEENASQYQQQQLHSHFASPCSSSNAFFQQQNLFAEGSQPAGGASESNHHNQNNLLQLGQAMFEWDFI